MNRTNHTLTALAAACMFAGTTLAQMDTTGKMAEDPNRTVTPADHPTGSMNNDMGGMKMTEAHSGSAPKDLTEAMKAYGSDLKTAPDKLFVYMAGIGNRTEIEAAKAAQSKTDSEEVKKVAKSIEQDHMQAQMKLHKVADALGVQWPAQLPPEKQEHLQLMSSMDTQSFNKAYIKHMLVDHAKDIAEYKLTASAAMNSEVKSYAAETLPHLIHHNKELNDAGKSLGLPSTEGVSMGDVKDAMGMK